MEIDMTRLSALFSLLVMLLAASFSRPVDAQVATGAPLFGTFSTQGPDVINIGNLNVLLNIPVLNKAGRGIPLTYNLAYNSSVWYPVTSGSTTSWTPVQQFGWQGLQPAGQAQITYQTQFSAPTCVNNSEQRITYQQWLFSGIQYVDPTGVRHGFNADLTFISGSSSVDGEGGCPANSIGSATSLVAADGSGYTATVTPGDGFLSMSLTNVKGTRITAPIVSNPQDSEGTASLTDSNGNEITTSNGQYRHDRDRRPECVGNGTEQYSSFLPHHDRKHCELHGQLPAVYGSDCVRLLRSLRVWSNFGVLAEYDYFARQQHLPVYV
jgi:hypothetical protein